MILKDYRNTLKSAIGLTEYKSFILGNVRRYVKIVSIGKKAEKPLGFFAYIENLL